VSSMNRHFKLESALMVAAFVIPIVLGVVAAIVVPYIRTQVAIDRCLDAGGSYDYKIQLCVGASSQ
jgi:hypothetical protein